LIEGAGTMELAAAERGGLRRMDVKEGSAQLRALAKHSVHAAFRYQKRAAETPGLAMEWVRFPDTPVLSAVAQHAVVTTLVTSEGRSLTEVKLTVKNREQPFLKVELARGAQILSAGVAGEKVKPVTAPDGDRVPLLRTGFRPAGPYVVSFVFLHAGSPFAKKGASELALPKMDVPVELVTWEVFLPKQYKVADFGGDAIPARLLPVTAIDEDVAKLEIPAGAYDLDSLSAGQMGGYIIDASGSVVPYATILATLPTGATVRTRADASGRWMLSDVPPGRVRLRVDASGFKSQVKDVDRDASRPGRYSFRLEVGALTETVTVTADGPGLVEKESQQIER